MIAFEILLNGEPICTAGVEPPGVLSFIASHVVLDPEQRPDFVDDDEWTAAHGTSMEVASLKDEQQRKWLERALSPGDVVTLRVVEREELDETVSS